MKKILSIFLALSLCLSFNLFVVNAVEPANVLQLKAKSAILIEAATGQVLFEQNSNEKLSPASITKIMTLILIMEALDSAKIKLTDKVICSENAAKMGGSQVFLEPGEEMTVDELLKAIAVASGNDASVMMGEYIDGSEAAFVEHMNLRATELGMKNTTFINCTGLDADGHQTTAYDVALMSRELLKHKQVIAYTTIWMDSLRNGKFGLANTNKLVRFYKDCNGLKTGSTDTALFCVSASALRNNMQLIAVVLASPTSKDRFADATKMLDYGFANWGVANGKNEDVINPVKVLKGVLPEVNVEASGEISILVTKGKEKLIQKKIEIQADVLAPVEKGQKLGEVIYTLENKEVGRTPIKAVSAVQKAGYFYFVKKLFSVLYS